MTDTTPTTVPGTLPGRARATGRPSTVAEGSRDLLWAAGSGRPRPFLAGEPQRTPGLEVKPSNIGLTRRSRPDLTLPPVTPRQRPGNAPITRRSHDEPRHRPTSISAASRRLALRVPGRNLHDDDRESVGVAGHHLDEAPGLALRLLLDHDIRGGEPSPLLVDIADLKQQPDGARWRLGRGSRDLEESRAKEEHDAAVGSATPLAEDGEAERLAVEAQRALEVAGVKQDSAGEDVHGSRIAAGEILRARARRGAGSRGCPRWPPPAVGVRSRGDPDQLGSVRAAATALAGAARTELRGRPRATGSGCLARGRGVPRGRRLDARSVERTRPFSAFAPARCDHAERPHFLRIPAVRGHRSPGGQPGLCALGAALCA
jgi:hypothetical protein